MLKKLRFLWGNQRKLFKISKELGGNSKTYNWVIKNARGNKLTSDQEKNERWKDNFQNVLNCLEPEVRSTWIDDDEQFLTISTSGITAEEVKQASDQLKNNCSPGEDLFTG